MPLGDTPDVIRENRPADITNVFMAFLVTSLQGRTVLTNKKKEIAANSPLSKAPANLFMKQLEEQVSKTTKFKTKIWFKYLGGTSMTRRHGTENTNDLLNNISIL